MLQLNSHGKDSFAPPKETKHNLPRLPYTPFQVHFTLSSSFIVQVHFTLNSMILNQVKMMYHIEMKEVTYITYKFMTHKLIYVLP